MPKRPKSPPVDFLLSDHGTIWLLIPQTPAAEEWATERLPEDCPTIGGRYAIEHRFIGPIVAGAREEGLVVL